MLEGMLERESDEFVVDVAVGVNNASMSSSVNLEEDESVSGL